MELVNRPRRLRTCDNLRRMVRETRVSPDSLVYPLFLVEGEHIREPIPSLEGQWRCSPDRIGEEIAACMAAGVRRVLLFGIPAHKDACGSSAWDANGVVQQGIRAIKAAYPECYVITDVCMCEYTDHGHCGIVHGHTVDNDKTLAVLCKTALSHVQAGADMVAPSVNVYGPATERVQGGFTGKTETSVGTALTAGCVAQMFQWGLVEENDIYMNGISVKNYLIRGARREREIDYPNRQWGYGEVDVYNSFLILTRS